MMILTKHMLWFTAFAVAIGFGCDGLEQTEEDESGTSEAPRSNSCDTDNFALVQSTPDPDDGLGLIQFRLDPEVYDICEVEAFVVGKQREFTVEHAGNGIFFLTDVPEGEYDLVITASILVDPSLEDVDGTLPTFIGGANLQGPSLEPGDAAGIRVNGLAVEADEKTKAGSIDLGALAAIAGKATLANGDAAAETEIAIPGTSFVTVTDADGEYSLDRVVPGQHVVRARNSSQPLSEPLNVELTPGQDVSDADVSVTSSGANSLR